MKGTLAIVAAATLSVVAMSAAPASAAASYGPGTFQSGPKNGDASAYSTADPATGKVTILQHNTRQAAAVNCIGDGPRATLLAIHRVTDQVSSVQVDYVDAMLSDHEIVMDVHVSGDKSGFLGHKADSGPKMHENGSIAIPLSVFPQPGETVTVQFGLQTGAGCLPHPFLLGLPGSRFVNGGEATFTSVKVG